MSKKELESATSKALESARKELEYSKTHNGYAPVPGPSAGQKAAHEMTVDMRAILHSLEDEYQELNLEYQAIIKKAVGDVSSSPLCTGIKPDQHLIDFRCVLFLRTYMTPSNAGKHSWGANHKHRRKRKDLAAH